MKRLVPVLAALVLTVLRLSAQEPVDTLATLRAAAEAENYRALTAWAADVTVVATHRVPRSGFFLWYGHLTDGSWGTDQNWYPRETDVLYLSRPGADGSLDIVCSRPLDTIWSLPTPLCDDAVSPGNEIFPMLSPDGKRLYFASDGLFGMGGYDLYVATWDPKKQRWGNVQNLGFPYNSQGDDLLYCDTPDGRYTLFASNRDCGRDSVVIYVLRQEHPVCRPVAPADVAAVARLAVTAPDNGYPFERCNLDKVPDIRFEEPEAPAEPEPPVKNKKTAAKKEKGRDKDKKKSSVVVITEEVHVVK